MILAPKPNEFKLTNDHPANSTVTNNAQKRLKLDETLTEKKHDLKASKAYQQEISSNDQKTSSKKHLNCGFRSNNQESVSLNIKREKDQEKIHNDSKNFVNGLRAPEVGSGESNHFNFSNQLFLNTQQPFMNNFDLKTAFSSQLFMKQAIANTQNKVGDQVSEIKKSSQERKLCNGRFLLEKNIFKD